MKILGHNLLPFTVAQLPANWTIGLDIEAYFFAGNIPTDLTSYITDHRNLFGNCIAANRIILKPTTEGLMLLQEYSHGFKAVSGSVYDPKLGVTIHYPKNMIPRTFQNSNSVVDIQTAYSLGMDSGNKKLKQQVSLALVNGFPIATDKSLGGNPLAAASIYASLASCVDLEYENSILFDAIVSDDATKPAAASLIMSNNDSAGTPAVGTEVTYTLPANVAANQNTTTITSSKLRIRGDAQSFRRLIPATVGDVHTTPVTKTIGWALLVFVDSNLNTLGQGLKDVRVMATKVGLLESGELIELASLNVSTGQFAEVLQVRTATTLDSSAPTPNWYDSNARIAFDSSKFGASPSADYLNQPFTFTGWPVQPDGSLRGLLNSTITFAKGTYTFDASKSFYIECDYRQSDISSNAEFNFLQVMTTFTNRINIAFDRSNQTGMCIWNNSQGPRVQRPFDNYTALLTTTFVKLKYVYDATTGTHTIYVNGTVIDTFTFVIAAYTLNADLLLQGTYGSAAWPEAFIKNFQIVQ